MESGSDAGCNSEVEGTKMIRVALGISLITNGGRKICRGSRL